MSVHDGARIVAIGLLLLVDPSEAFAQSASLNAVPAQSQDDPWTIRSAIHRHGTKNAALLRRVHAPAQMARRSCGAKVGIGAAVGAGVGAVSGAIGVGEKGSRGAGAAWGAVIFSIVGAGFGYKACGP